MRCRDLPTQRTGRRGQRIPEGLPQVCPVRARAEGHPGHRLRLGLLKPLSHSLYSGSSDKTIRVWSTADRSQLRMLTGHTRSIWALAVTPDGTQLYSGSGDCSIRGWPTAAAAAGSHGWTLDGHTDLIRALSIAPDGRALYSASWDLTIRVWSTVNRVHVQTFELSRGTRATSTASRCPATATGSLQARTTPLCQSATNHEPRGSGGGVCKHQRHSTHAMKAGAQSRCVGLLWVD